MLAIEEERKCENDTLRNRDNLRNMVLYYDYV